jgi:hypothetical protein
MAIGISAFSILTTAARQKAGLSDISNDLFNARRSLESLYWLDGATSPCDLVLVEVWRSRVVSMDTGKEDGFLDLKGNGTPLPDYAFGISSPLSKAASQVLLLSQSSCRYSHDWLWFTLPALDNPSCNVFQKSLYFLFPFTSLQAVSVSPPARALSHTGFSIVLYECVVSESYWSAYKLN